MSIMVVDDEEIVRTSLYYWFKKYGHEVEQASSAFEALEKLAKYPFNLLFVDIKMPGMDGIELLEKIKQEYPDTIVIIITTSLGAIQNAIAIITTNISGRSSNVIHHGQSRNI